LKIENQQYLEKIDDKNNELLDLKLKATNTTVYLNGKKRMMHDLTEKIDSTTQEIKIRTKTLKNLEEEQVRVDREVEEAREQLQKLKNKMDDFEVPATKNYILSKSKLDELRQSAKTWMRKVEISEMKLKSATQTWRSHCAKQATGSNNSQLLSNSSKQA